MSANRFLQPFSYTRIAIGDAGRGFSVGESHTFPHLYENGYKKGSRPHSRKDGFPVRAAVRKALWRVREHDPEQSGAVRPV